MKKRVFFIAGVHRSGTSYLTRTLSFAGLELPVSIQPGAPDNPKGHFESFNITRIHDRLLNDQNLTWDTFISPPESWFSSEYAEKAALELGSSIQSEFAGRGPIVLKDPRLSLFLPLWQNIARTNKFQDYYIVPLRHPVEVASSLQTRNKIGRSRSFLIWLNYLFCAEKNSRGYKRSFLHFPSWVKDINLTIEKIEKDLGTEFPNKNRKNLIKARIEFDQNLVHHEEPGNFTAQNDIETLCIEAYYCFVELLKKPYSTNVMEKIDILRKQFEGISSTYAEIFVELELKKEEEMKRQSSIAEQQSAELEEQLTLSRSEGAEAAAHANRLQEQLSIAEQQSAELEEQLTLSRSEGAEAAAHANRLQEQFYVEKGSNAALLKEINELRVQYHSLVKEHGQALLNCNNERLTVFRPIYRNFYKQTGLLLRSTFPTAWVESIKKMVPNPNGIPKRLTYQPQNSKKILGLEQFDSPMPTSSPDIFVLSIINWDFRYQRPQHIAKGLADAGKRVFYVEMELADSASEITKVSENLYRVRLSSQNLCHIQPYTGQPDPEQTSDWVSAFYDLCDFVKATSFKQIIIQHPFWWQLTRHLSSEYQVVFDCMDDIAGFSNTEQFLLDLELDLLRRADKLVVSSQYLFDKYRHFQSPVLIRNAAELEHFSNVKKKGSPPSFLQRHLSNVPVGKIKVGYVGAIAEWFDAELVRNVALSDSRLEFHLCGAVTTKESAQLAEIENIFMHGEIPYSDVPGFHLEMDVLTIPFKLVPIIQACDPVKFYEYSAMGKPTVTTALPELNRASQLTFVASSPEEFLAQIHRAAKAGKKHSFRKQLQEYAAENTWKHRISQFEEVFGNASQVSVVVLSYGDPELTIATLHSLYDGGPVYPNLEVIVVDNGSPADALRKIREFSGNYPNIKVIENGQNLGFAKGNNVGLEAATGDYVMLLNNDTVVSPGAIYAMVRHLERNPNIGAVGPLTNNIGNEAKLFVEYENMEQMKDVARQATTGYRGIFTPINVVAYFAVMFRRADLSVFGQLAEDYGRGMFEDDDHCALIKSKGYVCALAEDAFVHHHLSATFSKLDDSEKEALFDKNKQIFENKWGVWQPHEYRKERPFSSLREI